MKIPLTHWVFTEDPYMAFSKQHEVDPYLWREMYHNRYLWHQYDIPILTEFFNLKTGKNINERTIRRWIKRTILYNRAKEIRKRGVREVSHEFFENILTQKEMEEMFVVTQKE